MRIGRRVRIATLLLAAVAAGWAAWDHREGRRLTALVHAITDAGEPLTLEQWKRPRPGDAAAPYAAAIHAAAGRGVVQVTPVDALAGLPPDQAPPVYVVGQAADAVHRYRDAIALADEGSRLDFTAFRPGPATSPGGGEPALLSRVLELRATVAALTGDGEAAAAALVSCLRFYRTLNDALWEPGLAAVRGDQVQAVLERTAPSGASLDALAAALASLDRDDTFRRYVLRDRALFIHESWTDLCGTLPPDLRPDGTVNDRATIGDRLARPVRRYFAADRLVMLAGVASAAGRAPLLNSIAELAARPRGYYVLESRLGLHGWETRGVRSTWLRKYPVVAARYVRGQAIARAGRIIILAEQYRRSKGRFPSSLDELDSSVADPLPLDPVRGQPMQYRIRPDQLLVYGVGEDGRDDGGRIDGIDEAARQARHRVSVELDWGIRVRIRRR